MKKMFFLFFLLLPIVSAATMNNNTLLLNNCSGSYLTWNFTQDITFDNVTVGDCYVTFNNDNISISILTGNLTIHILDWTDGVSNNFLITGQDQVTDITVTSPHATTIYQYYADVIKDTSFTADSTQQPYRYSYSSLADETEGGGSSGGGGGGSGLPVVTTTEESSSSGGNNSFIIIPGAVLVEMESLGSYTGSFKLSRDGVYRVVIDDRTSADALSWVSMQLPKTSTGTNLIYKNSSVLYDIVVGNVTGDYRIIINVTDSDGNSALHNVSLVLTQSFILGKQNQLLALLDKDIVSTSVDGYCLNPFDEDCRRVFVGKSLQVKHLFFIGGSILLIILCIKMFLHFKRKP